VAAGAWLELDFAGTWMQAEYRTAFLACPGSSCPRRTCRSPPAPTFRRAAAWASLGAEWDSGGGWWTRIGRATSVRARRQRAPAARRGYTVVDAEADARIALAGHAGARLPRLENLFDRDYAGSVIVNEANGRYFEPAPGAALRGIDLRW
jgi:iron complex outermembrane receptor protein